MTTIVTVAAAFGAGCIVVRTLTVGAKLRLAVFVAQWSALFWIGLRVASTAVNSVA
ncbi:MAG: hypothetical protein ACREH4_02235 [Vitreimonas sp.]